jgi:tetratricopeptide (TPR) repeat protein
VDIPFIRFAFPTLILYLFWWGFVLNPYLDEAAEEKADGHSLSVASTQEMLSLSRQLIKASRMQEALAPLLRLHEAYPENQIYLQQLAETYDALGRYTEAAKMWEGYLQYSPTPLEGCPQVGLSYDKAGMAAESLGAFERCWKLDKDYSDSILFYGHALELDGQFKKALEMYQHGVKLSPGYSDLILGLARMEVRNGMAAAARPRVDKVLVTHPNYADALLTAGLVYSANGDKRNAIRYLQHAHEVSPNYKDVILVLERLGVVVPGKPGLEDKSRSEGLQ